MTVVEPVTVGKQQIRHDYVSVTGFRYLFACVKKLVVGRRHCTP